MLKWASIRVWIGARLNPNGKCRSQLGQHAWYDKNAADIAEVYDHRVGQKLPNPWGLCDMHGTVWEWCQEWYVPYGSEKTLGNLVRPAHVEGRVLRGGAFVNAAKIARSALRESTDPAERSRSIGFRAARAYP